SDNADRPGDDPDHGPGEAAELRALDGAQVLRLDELDLPVRGLAHDRALLETGTERAGDGRQSLPGRLRIDEGGGNNLGPLVLLALGAFSIRRSTLPARRG